MNVLTRDRDFDGGATGLLKEASQEMNRRLVSRAMTSERMDTRQEKLYIPEHSANVVEETCLKSKWRLWSSSPGSVPLWRCYSLDFLGSWSLAIVTLLLHDIVAISRFLSDLTTRRDMLSELCYSITHKVFVFSIVTDRMFDKDRLCQMKMAEDLAIHISIMTDIRGIYNSDFTIKKSVKMHWSR